MFRNPWRIWFAASAFLASLIGFSFLLHSTMPAQARFTLRGTKDKGIEPGILSPDGQILTTGTSFDAVVWPKSCASLKTWDTTSGQKRGEFFRDLVGAAEISNMGRILGRQGDPDERGFHLSLLRFSPDGRYCALLHRDGLALADLREGREWPSAIKMKIVEQVSGPSARVYRRLQRTIDTAAMQKRAKFKDALQEFALTLDSEFPILVDREAFASDPYEEEVALPPFPAKMTAQTALRILLSQIGAGEADYIIRPDFIEITTPKNCREVCPPVFSPHGSFLVLPERDQKGDQLHVVECKNGQVIATLSGQSSAFGFTRDEALFYFIDNKLTRPILNVWDTQQRQVVRSFKGIAGVSSDLSPDDKTLIALNESEKAEVLDLRTGGRRPIGMDFQATFSRDGKTLVCESTNELQIWDLATAKKQGCLDISRLSFPSLKVFMSADSRVVCAITHVEPKITAWDLQSRARLWPPRVPERDDPIVATNTGPGVEVQEWTGAVDDSCTFTPDHRFLIARHPTYINILEPSSGEVVSTLAFGEKDHTGHIPQVTPDGKFMLTQWSYDRKPSPVREWIARWLPWPRSTGCVVVSEVETGKVLIRVEDRGSAVTYSRLSDDGQTLLAAYYDGETEVLSCWDVPGRPSLAWTMGLPIASGCGGILAFWWIRKRNTARLVSAEKVQLPGP